jgi:parvulin-like peptidyl-prolyl isomerase
MANPEKPREKPRRVSKKHLARQEREARQTRIIIYGSIALLVIVAILVGVALVDIFIITPNKPVATVNGEKISSEDFQTRVKLDRTQLVSQYINTADFMQSFQDESTASYFQSTLQQIYFQLTPSIHGQSVLDTMIEDALIQQEADRLGITVSDSEVDDYIAEIFGYFPEGTPTTAPTSEPVPTSTRSPLQLTLVPLTPTAVVTETVEVEATPTEEVAAEPTEAPPTPTPYTEEAFQENYNQVISQNQAVGISEADFRKILRADILRTKIRDEITKDLPHEEEQVWARHILVATEEEAQAVLTRLESGEDFATLAMELSTDTASGANGGDLGWFGRGQMVAPFETAVFALDIGEISEPVQSDFGWHIIQKLGQETRPVDDATYEQMQQTTFTEWLDTQRANAEIESDDTWLDVYPETPNIPTQYLALIGQ